MKELKRGSEMGTLAARGLEVCVHTVHTRVLDSGCDFVGEYTNTQINKSPFFVSANVFSFAHRLMRICFVRKVVLLVNTQIHITK